eukprot:Anaeramoba_ignava/c21607_g2_i1.p1 GENE.c21607_g2_i1~~c21607_g2_i1.p1  ORF type:complete len:816 (-),score=192.59 c21607_g2_i1:24-2402(-)
MEKGLELDLSDPLQILLAISHPFMRCYASRVVYRTQCILITPMRKTPGYFCITNNKIKFIASIAAITERTFAKHEIEMKDRSRKIEKMTKIIARRFIHRWTALEFFFMNKKSLLFSFQTEDVVSDVLERLRNLDHSRALFKSTEFCISNPVDFLRKSGITRRWKKHKITNFQYLMGLNSIASRSYNDLSQYPVFPWILRDYTSNTIDLSDPKIYRDLSKPIGALDTERLQTFLERFKSFPKEMVPFMYGSHYSSFAIVLFYLIRTEPFTTYSIQFQDGKFDKSDRIFSSVSLSWQNCLSNSADVRELIPEFFYFPHFLENPDAFDLGTKQTSDAKISNVELPPWAESSQHYVHILQTALESPAVSEHIHEWIDLIFGYKQQGEEAVRAFNVFHNLTYEESVNYLMTLEDEEQQSVEAQIEMFGQTPPQLFSSPHPKRLPAPTHSHLLPTWNTHSPEQINQLYSVVVSEYPLVLIDLIESQRNLPIMNLHGKLVCLDFATQFRAFHWVPLKSKFTQFELELDTYRPRNLCGMISSMKISPQVWNISLVFALSQDKKYLVIGGFWDASFHIASMKNFNTTQKISHHIDLVTCIELQERYLITGSKDTTSTIWNFDPKSGVVDELPIAVLSGHTGPITSVALNIPNNIAVSVSIDGLCLVYRLSDGLFVRSISINPHPVPFNLVRISHSGDIFLASLSDFIIRRYDINGCLLATSSTCGSEIVAWQFIQNDSLLFVGLKNNLIQVWFLDGLKMSMIWQFQSSSPISCITIPRREKCIIVGTRVGEMLIYSFELPK